MRRIALACAALVACSGQDGQDGEDGRNGKSAVVDVRPANEDECPSGGHVVKVGVDDETEDVVVCNGEPGPEGPRGSKGDAGPPESDAESIGAIEASITCGAQLEGEVYWFTYMAAVFTDGTVFVTAGVRDGATETSTSAVYAPEQNGATIAAVTLQHDAIGELNGGFWLIGLDREDLVVMVTYVDSDAAGGELSWTLPAESNNCVVNSYD